MKVAIVHDWLTGMRGGEKCLDCFCELFPRATVFTLIHKKGSVSRRIESMDIRTSFLQCVPGIFAGYRNFLPFFPKAIESFDLSGYDLILSSSHCVAKGARVPEKALHICYCYTPVRYAWSFFDEYFESYGPIKKALLKAVMNGIKKWDVAANKGVDYFVAISHNVKNRIKMFYSKDADVIYPPVDVGIAADGSLTERIVREEGAFYFVVSALVPYKRVDLAVDAFNASGKRLLVVGTGDREAELKRKAGPGVKFLGWLDEAALASYYEACEAVIFPGEEDFGIVPLEAQGRGKPVIAYGKGGALETVVPLGSSFKEPTGVFFYENTAASLNSAIGEFEKNKSAFAAAALKNNAARFSRERFKEEISSYIKSKCEKHNKTERMISC